MYTLNFETLYIFIDTGRDNACSVTQMMKFGFYSLNLKGYILILDANSSWKIHLLTMPNVIVQNSGVTLMNSI